MCVDVNLSVQKKYSHTQQAAYLSPVSKLVAACDVFPQSIEHAKTQLPPDTVLVLLPMAEISTSTNIGIGQQVLYHSRAASCGRKR